MTLRLTTAIGDLVPATDGVVSVWLGGLDGGTWAATSEHEQHYAASTMKLPVAAAAYRLRERGELGWDTPIEVRAELPSALPGARFAMDPDDDQDPETWRAVGSTVTLGELVHRSLVLSSNIASNLVLAEVGLAEVARVLADAGCSDRTHVLRGIEDAPAREAGRNNIVTAHDLGLVMAAVGDRRLAAPATCAELEDVLSQQTHRDLVPAGLPAGTYVANKTGWVDGVLHDVALVRPAGRDPFVLVVLTSTDLSEEDGTALVAELVGRVWDAS